MTLYTPEQHELYDGRFVIRGTRNPNNHPDREMFDHFFAMEVTWR